MIEARGPAEAGPHIGTAGPYISRPAKAGRYLTIAALVLAVPIGVMAQAGRGRGGQPAGAAPAAGASAAAPVDLTGYWVSIVTEDWIERMSPDSPPSGVPRGGRGRGAGAAAGAGAQPVPSNEPCRAYGAAGSLRVPGRLHITWADANTLKIDMDAGTQTRLLYFTAVPAPAQKTLQGHSIARWEVPPARGGGGGRGGAPAAAPPAPRWGSLRVVTTNMTGGYLLSQRSPYSDNAVLTEHFTRHSDFGADYVTVTAIVEDGGAARITSSTFKKEPDGSKFSPSGCDVVR
jgi:hypothetical protein